MFCWIYQGQQVKVNPDLGDMSYKPVLFADNLQFFILVIFVGDNVFHEHDKYIHCTRVACELLPGTPDWISYKLLALTLDRSAV